MWLSDVKSDVMRFTEKKMSRKSCVKERDGDALRRCIAVLNFVFNIRFVSKLQIVTIYKAKTSCVLVSIITRVKIGYYVMHKNQIM